MAVYDVIVVGLGGMGSSAAYHLAARGQRVLGLEQFGAAHDRGSSHGGSRITRQSYFEDPAYVPLLLRAYELWEKLERDAGGEIMSLTGGVFVGRPESHTFGGSLRASREWDLPHEILDASELRRRFPTFSPRTRRWRSSRPRRASFAPRRPWPLTSSWPGGTAPTCATTSRSCDGRCCPTAECE